MKAKKINDDIVLIDNFLPDDELDLVRKNIKLEKEKLQLQNTYEMTGFHDTAFHRIYLDLEYIDNRQDSYLLSIISKHLFGKRINRIMNKQESYAFNTYFRSDRHETQLTVYAEGGKYNWHQDNDQRRLLSYVLPIDVYKKTWTGGELKLKYKGEIITIEPKENQLILFSGHLYHKVNDIIMTEKDDILKGRVVLNGHIGFQI